VPQFSCSRSARRSLNAKRNRYRLNAGRYDLYEFWLPWCANFATQCTRRSTRRNYAMTLVAARAGRRNATINATRADLIQTQKSRR